MLIPFLGVLLSLVFLVTMAYRGHSVVVVAPFAALIAVLFSGVPVMGTYTQIFMPALGSFIVKYFPLFLFGSIFGFLMTSTGLASYLARGITSVMGPKQAMFSTVLATTLLTFGGVSAWVVAFTVVPLATALFKEAGIPRRLMPAAIALGTITFALAALPGSPQIHNAIPTSYFGTTVYAAPIFGLVSSAVMFAAGIGWLDFRVRQLHRAGERFEPLDSTGKVIKIADDPVDRVPENGFEASGEVYTGPTTVLEREPSAKVQGLLGIIPILVVVIVNFGIVYGLDGRWRAEYLSEEKYGSTSLDALMGIWSPTIALAVAVGVIVLMFPKRVRTSVEEFSEGAKNAIIPCFTTASEVGYGAVIASLAVFVVVKESMLDVSDNALVVSTVSAAVISGITGSAAGGLSITMQTLGDQLASLAAEQGISLELMHRVTAMASVSFDSLPHNGAVLTMLIVCGMTHRLSYKDVAMVTVVIPIVTLCLMLGVHSVVPSFV